MTHPSVLRLARGLARQATEAGAQAVVLTGSHATGDANAHSDIDLLVIGKGPEYTLSRRGTYLVSVQWRTAAACRASLRKPDAVGAAVPRWRQAMIIDDPRCIAAALQRRAHAFTWEGISGECDRWVAEQITGYAEEVHKLVAALDGGPPHAAAVWRSVLAIRLAPIMAVHRRILYGSENALWDLVARDMGEPWAGAQSRALGETGESVRASGRAALELYIIAAREIARALAPGQRRVVHAAVAIVSQVPGAAAHLRRGRPRVRR